MISYNSLVVHNSEGVKVTGKLPFSEIHTANEKKVGGGKR